MCVKSAKTAPYILSYREKEIVSITKVTKESVQIITDGDEDGQLREIYCYDGSLHTNQLHSKEQTPAYQVYLKCAKYYSLILHKH
jgi:hypothetical protein